MTLPRRPSAVVFDMDGLLFDTETLSFESAVSAAKYHGFGLDWPLFRTMIGKAWPSIREQMLAHFGSGLDVDRFRTTWLDHYADLLTVRLALKAGVVELLDVLEQHQIRCAVATGSAYAMAMKNLETFSLSGRFQEIVAAGDYVSGKPSPEPFLVAASRLGVKPEDCLALEDSYNGVRAARAAGMMTIMVPDLLDPTEEIRTLCDHVLLDLHHVADVIIGADF